MARPIALVVYLCICAHLCAQTPSAQSPWSLGRINFSGIVDAFYEYNANHPGDKSNTLHAFDTRSGTPALSMAKITLDSLPAPVGFHLEAGFGKAFDAIESSAPAGGLDAWKNIMQAYLSVKPKSWKGVQIDAGKFNTTVSAELTDPLLNFNYSRSLLFALAPYYHTGLRLTAPLSKTFTGGVQLVEGWNGYDGKNHGLTTGVTGTWTPNQRVSWTNTLYSGPEDYYGSRTYRNFFDSALAYSPNPRTGIYVNFDYGHDQRALQKTAHYYGLAAAVRHQFQPKWAFAVRGESYRDANGFWTGTPRTLSEATATLEYKQSRWLISRLEYRRDCANSPYFASGPAVIPVRDQNTVTLGLIAYFGPSR